MTDRYALINPDTGLYWNASLPNDLTLGLDKNGWRPTFQKDPSFEYSRGRIEYLWNRYEHWRQHSGSDAPVLALQQFLVIIQPLPPVMLKLDPLVALQLSLLKRHGHVVSTAMTKACQYRGLPIVAIKRRGKTKDIQQVLPESIAHEGMFMFCFNDDDVVLAKIALGTNIARLYDIRDMH